MLERFQMLQGDLKRVTPPRAFIVAAALAAASVAAGGTALAGGGQACDTSECGDIGCARERTLCLVKHKNPDLALELLKKEKEKLAGSRTFALLLAKAWALGTLQEYLDSHPDDCIVRSWIIWIHVSEASLGEAKALLAEGACGKGEEKIALRFSLLEAFIGLQQKEEKEGKGTAACSGKKIRKIFDEDIQLARYLRSALEPHYMPPLTLKAGVKGGYTTNALFGSPQDPVNEGKETGSPVLALDLRLGATPPIWDRVFPTVDLSADSIIFFTADTKHLSYVDFAIRPGVGFFLAGEAFPRLFIGYRGDLLLLNMPDRYDENPNVFYEGHRAEIELALMPSVVFFAGGGRRFFREEIRTRWEVDGGMALQKSILEVLTLQGAAVIRMLRAEKPAYDVFGASGLLAISVSFGKGLQLKGLLAGGMDNYPESYGFFEPGDIRRDVTVRTEVEFSARLWKGLKMSVLYDFSDRVSTVSKYSFMDHRILLGLEVSWDFDFLKAKAGGESGHVPLGYGLEAGGNETVERIQDMLKENEYVGGGPSCGCRE
jgi:hypothetical protein